MTNLFALAVAGKIELLSASDVSGKGSATLAVENPTAPDSSASSAIVQRLRVSDVISACDEVEAHDFDMVGIDCESFSLVASDW